MKLNPDCLRDVLISVEEHTGYKVRTYYPSDKMNSLRKKYSDMEIRYHIIQASKAGLIEPITEDDQLSRIFIDDLTPKGHDFLANIRSDTFFEKAKKIAKELGLESVRDLHQIATSIALVAIKGYFGLP